MSAACTAAATTGVAASVQLALERRWRRELLERVSAAWTAAATTNVAASVQLALERRWQMESLTRSITAYTAPSPMDPAGIMPTLLRAFRGAVVIRRRWTHALRRTTILAAAAFLGAACPREKTAPGPLVNLDGQIEVVTREPSTRAWVVAFLGIECPIANRCLPELAALEAKHATNGVRFVHVYPNPDETPERIRRHREEYGLKPRAYLDPEHRLAKQFHAHRTPEVVVISREGRTLYQGRVNDQYAALGVARPAPTRHDLAEVLDALARGEVPASRVAPAVGCSFRATP